MDDALLKYGFDLLSGSSPYKSDSEENYLQQEEEELALRDLQDDENDDEEPPSEGSFKLSAKIPSMMVKAAEPSIENASSIVRVEDIPPELQVCV